MGNKASWPTAEEMKLDESQYKAVELALENKLALIQGYLLITIFYSINKKEINFLFKTYFILIYLNFWKKLFKNVLNFFYFVKK